MNYFAPYEVASCARHIETKQVFNKHWNKWWSLGNKLHEMFDLDGFDERRFNMMAARLEGVELELSRIAAALRKCCDPNCSFGQHRK